MKKLFTLTLLAATLLTATTTFTSCSKEDDAFQLNRVMEGEIDINYLNDIEGEHSEYIADKYSMTPQLYEFLYRFGSGQMPYKEITDVKLIDEWVNKDKPIHFLLRKESYNPKNYHIIKYKPYYLAPDEYSEDGEYYYLLVPIDAICVFLW